MLNDCIKIQSIWVISRHRLAVIVHQPFSLSPQFSAISHLCFSCRNAEFLLYAKITFYSLFSLCFNAFIMSLDEETISFNIASSRSLFLPLTSYI